MTHLKITKGLDIPILGKPHGPVQELIGSGSASPIQPTTIALDLRPFEEVKFKILVKPGDVVTIGQPLAEDKSSPGRLFCSPAGGIIKEVRRGYKRSLLDIVIEVASKEEFYKHSTISISQATREQMIGALLAGGLFAHIHSRPFNRLADPSKSPRTIFVKAVESAPFVPPAELQVTGHEEEFQAGLTALSKLTTGSVNLVYRADSNNSAFTQAKDVQKHTIEGPHPIGTHSLHIQSIDPIQSIDDIIWTLNVNDVIAIGHLLTKGHYYTDRIISIAGPGVLPERVGYFKGRMGLPISSLTSGRLVKGPTRFVSGDPLMGKKVTMDDYLGFYHDTFCVIPENTHREFLHFFRLGSDKYTFSRAYLSGHLKDREYFFDTNQHGEHRPFIDSTLYDEVMPLPISTMLLVKAVMAEDFERAEKLGLLDVDSEDFALPTFVCPSKMEMTDIIKNGLNLYAKDLT